MQPGPDYLICSFTLRHTLVNFNLLVSHKREVTEPVMVYVDESLPPFDYHH